LENVAFGSSYDDQVALGYKVALTEWNYNAFHGKKLMAGRDFTLKDPAQLATAGFLHGMIRKGDQVSLATQSMLLGQTWGITAIRGDAKGEEPPYWLPQGQVSRFYRHLTGSERLASILSNTPTFAHPGQLTHWYPALETLPMLDAVVTRDQKDVFIHVINRDWKKKVPLAIKYPQRWGKAAWTHYVLGNHHQGQYSNANGGTGLKMHAFSGGTVDQLFQLSLPPASVSIIRLEKE
jgi:alpha-L-arabinofuranosidase